MDTVVDFTLHAGTPVVLADADTESAFGHCLNALAAKTGYDEGRETGQLVVDAVVGAPVGLLAALVSVRVLGVRVVSGDDLALTLTSTAGVAQVVPLVEGLFLWSSQESRLTAVGVFGTGTVEFFAAGS